MDAALLDTRVAQLAFEGNRMSPAINSTKAADTASDNAGSSRKMAARPPRNATRMPAKRNPPMKLKSLRFNSA
jgi:hypothetical protein